MLSNNRMKPGQKEEKICNIFLSHFFFFFLRVRNCCPVVGQFFIDGIISLGFFRVTSICHRRSKKTKERF